MTSRSRTSPMTGSENFLKSSCPELIRPYNKLRCLRARTYSSVAPMVEHAAVNRAVVGSSPTRGARFFSPFPLGFKFLSSSMVEHAAVNRAVARFGVLPGEPGCKTRRLCGGFFHAAIAGANVAISAFRVEDGNPRPTTSTWRGRCRNIAMIAPTDGAASTRKGEILVSETIAAG